ncbi:MAG: nucleotide exchange factor GrpE [Candidatus Bathyarchaeia archaeon]
MVETSEKDMCREAKPETVQEEEGRRSELEVEVERLNEALASEKARSEGYLNRLKYLQAEIENIQKRARRDVEEITRRANERLISSLLTVIDDMEMAVKVSYGGQNCEGLRSGLELIMKKFMSILEGEGLTRIEAVGKPFDPAVHEAADQIVKEDTPEGMIVDELRAGYIFKGKLIRPSIVIVAKNIRQTEPFKSC